MYNVKFALASVAILCAVSAHAADQTDGYTVGALGDINSETIITNAKLSLKQAKDKLSEASATSPNAPLAPPVIHEIAGSALPNVTTIMGDEAQFLFVGGTSASGHVGSMLPGGFKILAISFSDRTVTVKDVSGHTQILSMSGNAPVAAADPSTSSAGQQGFAIPPGMPTVSPIVSRSFH